MRLIENLGIILIVFVIVIASVLIILIIIEKKLKFISKIKKKNKNQLYIEEVKKIKKSDPEKALKSIDDIAKRFFEEAFKIKKFTGYFELKKFFDQQKNTKAIKFCEYMNMLLYSKKKNKKTIQKLTNLT